MDPFFNWAAMNACIQPRLAPFRRHFRLPNRYTNSIILLSGPILPR
jgi:hypothetical protein